MIKELESVIEDSEEMGCVGSDGEDELRARPKRVKFSNKKFCDDSVTTVDYASVPRKLRSAVKKRSRESVSPRLLICKKLNYVNEGIECPRKDGLKKFKVSTKHGVSSGSVSEVVVGSITKDEEDVAETLFALAGMFTKKTANNETKLEDEPLISKSTDFLDKDSSRLMVKAIPEMEAGIKTIDRDSVEAPNRSLVAGGPVDERDSVQFMSKVSQLEKSLRRKLSTDLHHRDPQLDLPSTVLNSNAERGIQRLPFNTAVPGDPWSRNNEPVSNINQQELSLESSKKFEAGIIGGQYELYTVTESKRNGSVLWPGLSLTEQHNSDTQGRSMSFTTKSPAVFLNTSSFLQPSGLENYVAMEKVGSKKSRRRCSTHVLVSHLIKDLQKAMQSSQLIYYEGLSQGALITSNTLTGRSNGLNRIGSTNNRISSAAERNLTEVRNASLHKRLFQDQQQDSTKGAVCSATQRNLSEVKNGALLYKGLPQDQQQCSVNSIFGSAGGCISSEVRNAILLHKRLVLDQQQAGTSTQGLYAFEKQNLDFFTMMGKSSRVETSLGAGKQDSGRATMAQLHMPCLQPKTSRDKPFQLHENCYLSTPFLGHQGGAASARQVQLAPYLGSSSYAPLVMGVTTSSKQAVWQQQHQDWSVFTVPQKTHQDAAPNTQNWQNEVQDGAYLLHHAQSLFPPSHSSVGMFVSNYSPQQQQPLISISSPMQQSKVRHQHSHMPYKYQ